MLEEAGYRVEAVGSGQDALAALECENFDLILVDSRATAAIHDRKKVTGLTGRNVPVIAVSRHSSSEEHRQCLQAGIDAYLAKPIQLVELLPEIRRLTAPPETQARSASTPEAPALSASLNLLAAIHDAIRDGDIETIRKSAEALKGSITSVLAKEAFGAASALEKTECHNDLARAQEACRRLQAAIHSLNRAHAGRTKD